MTDQEQQLADNLQRESNIDKIRKAVEKVNAEREVENSSELNFDNNNFGDAWECEK